MTKRSTIALLLTAILLLTAGARITWVDHNHAGTPQRLLRKSDTQKDKDNNQSSSHHIFTSRRAALLPVAGKLATDTYIPAGTRAAQPSFTAWPYLSAAQGMEVHLAGLEWNGRFLSQDAGDSLQYRYTQSISGIHLDPDHPHTGRPDLYVAIVNAPEVFNLGAFSGILPKALQADRPVDSWQLMSGGEPLRMELWLVSFDMTFRIEPATHAHRTRGRKEFKNQGYDNLTVFLQFLPKTGAWYIADTAGRPAAEPPHIAVAGAEVLEVNYDHPHNRLGVNLTKGQALPLYPSLAGAQSIVTGGAQQGMVVSRPVHFTGDDAAVLLNPTLFDRPRYSAIDVGNIGSWKVQQGGLFRGPVYRADQYHVRVLVHLYVIGDWLVKGEQFVDFEARAAFEHARPGLVDYLLPDFRLGWFGRLLSGGLLLGVVVLILALFFPAVPALINAVFRSLAAWIRKFLPMDNQGSAY